MFSQEARCVYRSNPLAEVICQLRFPEILTIQTELPARFQEAIRGQFPQYALRSEPVLAKPGTTDRTHTNNYQFSAADGSCRINLTSKFISLSCSRYRRWEEFAALLDQPLAAFIQTYSPAYFERVGLRYLNFISRQQLGLEEVPFRELIAPCYLGVLQEETLAETAATRSTVDAEFAVRGGCRAKIHSGPGKVTLAGKPDSEVKFILDLDLYMSGNVPVNVSAGALQTLHSQAYPLFRYAITDTLHEAMGPKE